jgi:hypothetical protein
MVEPFGPVVNNSGDIVFIGDLSSPGGTPLDKYGVFLFSKGATIAVARPGDSMPGGGKLRSFGKRFSSECLLGLEFGAGRRDREENCKSTAASRLAVHFNAATMRLHNMIG